MKKTKLMLSKGSSSLRKLRKFQEFQDSQKHGEREIFRKAKIRFSEEQLGPAKSNYKKILEVKLDIKNNEIIFQCEPLIYLVIFLKFTKRNVLKEGESVYDPLDFIFPITAIIIQLLRKDQRLWDKICPMILKLEWFFD